MILVALPILAASQRLMILSREKTGIAGEKHLSCSSGVFTEIEGKNPVNGFDRWMRYLIRLDCGLLNHQKKLFYGNST
jgi:hypothetical protein